MYCLIVLSFFSPASNECKKKSDQYLICYIEIHTDDPQKFWLHMDLTLKEGYWIKLCIKSITLICLGNYYTQF
jgi:hypothetical protein